MTRCPERRFERLHVVGLSHRSAPLEVRARAALSGGRSAHAAARALANGASEAVVVATCNRTELYVVGDRGVEWAAARALLDVSDLSQSEYTAHCYRLSGHAALRHLFRVAASLESMNVGEPEIQGQLRAAVRDADAADSLGPTLRAAFRHALAAGKRVRRLTGIGRGAVALPSLVIETARDDLGGLDGIRAVVVGAGHMARQVTRALASQPLAELVVLNRSRDAAERLARSAGATAGTLAELEQRVAAADVVVCCTAAREPVLDAALLVRAVGERTRPLVVVDLALPPDVARGCESLPNVRTQRLDALVARALRNRGERDLEARRAEQIVAEFLGRVLESAPAAPASTAA